MDERAVSTPAGLDQRVAVTVGSFDLDVALARPAGRTVAILGPNGAGKSTLLRALAGLLQLTSGHVQLDDIALAEVEPEARPIGVVFQDYLLFPNLSAAENVAFGLRCRGENRRHARAEAIEWLAKVGLSDEADKTPSQLSGGQAQRVALARALATRPRMLLLDEPLAALDATTRPVTRRFLQEQLAGFDGVRIVVTHDPVEAMALADELVVIEQGRVAQAGAASEITSRPRTRYVADLVGVNLLAGRGTGTTIELDSGGELAVADSHTGPVLAVVHPRAVSIHRERPDGSARNVWPVAVAHIDNVGDRTRVSLSGPIELVAEVTPAAVTDLGLSAGAAVWIAVKATEVSVYPA